MSISTYYHAFSLSKKHCCFGVYLLKENRTPIGCGDPLLFAHLLVRYR